MRPPENYSSKSSWKLPAILFLLSAVLAPALALVGGSWTETLRAAAVPNESLLALRARPDALAVAEVTPPAPASKAFQGRLPITELSEDEAVLHALNRLGYGPRPGEVERIHQMGLERWLRQQIHPETIDDSALAARLETYPTLAMSPAKLIEEYPPDDVAAKRLSITAEEYRKRKENARKAAVAEGLRPPAEMSPQRILEELSAAKLLRGIYSERQLLEQMTDFWFNHFNVFFYKDADRFLVASYERDVIRPHALGKFRELLGATAFSPAMLFYLDNWLSSDPYAFERLHREPPNRRPPAPPGQAPPPGPKRGLNENYGRELLELHTLGVDGGYTQKDVIAVARCFTGWTIRDLRTNPQFAFDPRIHDPDKKIVLGKKIHAGGVRDGEEVLKSLSNHSSTGRFISTKLARHFVSDQPPATLVAAMAGTFRKTDGDIRAVLQTMVYSKEFWSRAAFRAKVKTPFELVASTARALGADVDAPLPLVQAIARIGEPLYQCLPPTGYSDKAEAWVNTGALLNRLNFAIALASNHMRGTRVELEALLSSDPAAGQKAGDPSQALSRAVALFLAGQVSPETRETLEKKSTDPQIVHALLDDPLRHVDLGLLTGLVLGSPEFQRR